MALQDMDLLVSSTNQLAQTIQEIADRKEEKRRYEEEQKRLQEQTEWERQQAQKNYELQQFAFQYQQELNKQTQLREDNAFQRRLQDYRSAGLSPLGALGQQAGSGALTSLSAPQYDTTGVRSSVQESVRNSRNSIQQRMEYGLRMRQLNLEATNQALQTIKMNNEIKTEKIKREQLNEQIASSKAEREWMSKNGYRGENFQQALISAIHSYLDSRSDKSGMFDQALDISEQSVKKGLSSLSVSAQEQINKLPEPQKKAVFTYIGAVVGSAYVRLKNNPSVMFGKYIYQNMFHKLYDDVED